jgi:hypothetical protein
VGVDRDRGDLLGKNRHIELGWIGEQLRSGRWSGGRKAASWR